jgi:hypothetical protein
MDKIIETIDIGSRMVTVTVRERSTGVRYLHIQAPFGKVFKIEKDQINNINNLINNVT